MFTKKEQLKNNKVKKESTFGKKKCFIKKKPRKTKKTDVLDKNYSAWLRKQPCVLTGVVGCHGHHIYGRYPSQNDYLQVPLVHYAHNIAPKSYHETGTLEFCEHWGIDLYKWGSVKSFFYGFIDDLISRYESETGLSIDRNLLKDKKEITRSFLDV